MAHPTDGQMAISELKARCCHLLDAWWWATWTGLLADDLVFDTSQGGGPPSIHGRVDAMAMVRQTLESAHTVHRVDAPDITIAGKAARTLTRRHLERMPAA